MTTRAAFQTPEKAASAAESLVRRSAMCRRERVTSTPPARALPNPRMQPTGGTGTGRRAGGTLRWSRQMKRRFVRARARWPAADAQVVRPHRELCHQVAESASIMAARLGESLTRWLTREVLALVGLFGLLFSAALYVVGFVLANVDALSALAGQQLPTVLRTVGAWGVALFMVGEVVLNVSGWLLRLGAHSDEGPTGGQQGKGAA